MSCEECERAQDDAFAEAGAAAVSGEAWAPTVYVRVGVGDVLVIGCMRHMRQVIEYLRIAQAQPGGATVRIRG